MTGTAAVIPNWNGGCVLPAMLRSLEGQGFADVVVVDNGSADGSWQAAQGWGARVIRLERNYGFAYAVNQGIQATGTENVASINNDVELQAGWLAHLVDKLGTDPQTMFVVGKIFVANSSDKILDGTFDAVSRAACAW
ncbi:MAG: glycosyltransferase, partial [Bryobacterales bacterium]|nr:glycosyltransferase [Bryobacterales bacterium]